MMFYLPCMSHDSFLIFQLYLRKNTLPHLNLWTDHSFIFLTLTLTSHPNLKVRGIITQIGETPYEDFNNNI